MKILIDHHEPFFLAHGGLQVQIRQTVEALRRQKADVEFVRWWDEEQSGDLIHFFGRPPHGMIHTAKEKGVKFVFSELLTAQGSRSKAALAMQEHLSSLARAICPSVVADKAGWTSYAQADGIIALTHWEADLMKRLYGADPARTFVIGNGVEPVFFDRRSGKGASGLLTVGTITPRKRTLELAKACVAAGTPLRVVGKPYSENDEYFQEFLALVRRNPGLLVFEGPVEDREALSRLYAEAQGFVLLSNMESQSLAALEAAAGGLPLLLSDLPWARETFGKAASYIPVDASESDVAQALRMFLQSPPPIPQNIRSWDDVAKDLMETYRRLL